MIKSELRADYRVQELLSLLSEGVLEVAFVREKLAAWAGDAVELVHYSSGEYDIVMIH